MRTTAVVTMCAALVIGGTLSAHAQGPTPSTATVDESAKQKARELYNEGTQRMSRGQYAEARVSYLASWKMHKHWSTAIQLAYCGAKLGQGHDAEAAQALAWAFHHWPDNEGKASKPKAATLLKDLKPKLGAIEVKSNVGGALVYVDGEMLGPMPLEDPVYLGPGTHAIEVRGAGGPVTKKIEAKAGVSEVVEINAVAPATSASAEVAASSSSAPPAIPTASTSSTSTATGGTDTRTIVLVAGGVLTAVSLGVAVVYAIKGGSAGDDATSANDQVRATYGSAAGCRAPGAASSPLCADLRSALDRRDSANRMEMIGWIGTGVFGVATAATYLLWPKKSDVVVTPQAGAGTMGLTVRGAF